MPLADPDGGLLDLLPVGNVADLRLGADLRRDALQALGPAREQDAAPAACSQEPSRGGPDPARSPGYDGDANGRRLTRLSGQSADDPAVVPVVIRDGLGVRDETEPELGLDRLALVGQGGELHLVEVRPARPLDRHDQPQHPRHHGSGASGVRNVVDSGGP